MQLWVGISLGDITGIGPEVTLKALAAGADHDDGTRYLLIGDAACLDRLNAAIGLPLAPFADDAAEGRWWVVDPRANPLPEGLEPGAPAAARAAVEWLREGAARCLRGELAALVTAPVSKAAIIRSGQPFVGQTEFLADLAGEPQPVMMLLGADDRGRWLRVALATTHVPVRRLAEGLTRDQVRIAIVRAAQACRDLGLLRARVGVCGLNPHAGEGGELGTEEITTIGPAVQDARASGADVVGPLAADALFHHALHGQYDAVVAMFHDQGLAPLKLVAFDSGVNWTLGLPFIRTSPDHGTAYDLAGKNQADPSSMIAAIQLAKQLARRKRTGGWAMS
jgi:4-hydroxythreonine-4-phosphate dehydrogenase